MPPQTKQIKRDRLHKADTRRNDFFSRLSQFAITLPKAASGALLRWVARKQQDGRQREVYLTFLPLAVLFAVAYSFIINELMFKGISALREQPVGG